MANDENTNQNESEEVRPTSSVETTNENERESGRPRTEKSRFLKSIKDNPGALVMLAFAGIILWSIYRGLPVIDKLAEPSFARGLITFIISFATVGMAFMLVWYAFAETTDERFKRAREIFAGLLGILGTIVGFYFGSATSKATPMSVADIRVSDKEVVTFVSGGTPPYQCTIRATGEYNDGTPIGPLKEPNTISQNGWIQFVFARPLKTASLEIDIKDSQSRAVMKEFDFKASESAIAKSASEPPKQPDSGN